MSDKYSIDDILADVDKKRSTDGHSAEKHTESITEIIGGSELDKLIRNTGAKTRIEDGEDDYAPLSEQEEADRRAESIRSAAEENERRKAAQKQKKAEAEEKRRRERSLILFQ